MIKSGDVKCNVHFGDPTEKNIEKWNNFLDAVRNDLYYNLQFCNSNGEVQMTTDNGMVKFIISKYGAGGDGRSVIKVKNGYCINAISLAIDEIEKYIINRKIGEGIGN